ncbi:MAG: TatD family hydrolase [Steroidobacteraceae bacterium]
MRFRILSLDLVDIGSNLTHDSFTADRDAVMARAWQAGVRRQIITGADLASSHEAAALAVQHAGRLWSTAGVHPHHAQSFTVQQRADLAGLLLLKTVVAVGECGLDYFRNLSPPEEQRQAFISQLEIAAEVGKPVFLHQRDAHGDFTAILQDFAGRLHGGVAHCFTGGAAELEVYLGLGLYIGITGWACDERRGLELRSSIVRIPLDKLLIETDAPYLLPRDLSPKPKSRRNEPGYLPHIAATVAALRGESIETVGAATTRNAVALFALTDS